MLIFVYFLVFFVVAQVIRNNSIVDIGWGFGFVVVALATLLYTGAFAERNLLLPLL
ncbi:MAG: DUF1295 domain-containing protein, partial [Firmicutes bacterium]|nr:DUF1295 domain-containing protein [Bacillota bacterium]